MAHEVKLGQLIEGSAKRDAVHVAVAPAVANETLGAGQHVGFIDDESTRVGLDAKKSVGIVDPFLTDEVRAGKTFWLFLYPGSITSLRHDWSHPAFADDGAPTRSDKAAAKEWIEAFAARIGQTYSDLMEAARDYDEHGSYTYDNSERYKDHWGEFPEFWKHYEVVTGKVVDEKDGSPFTCSC